MPAVQPLKRSAERTLWFLEAEAWHGRGWWRRGVRGWRFYVELEDAIGSRLPDVLPELSRRGYVDRTATVALARDTPVWLYRISRAGVAFLRKGVGLPRTRDFMNPLPENADPDAGSLYLPVLYWHVLDLLRRHASHGIGPERFGQAGWMLPAEMRPRLREAVGVQLPWLLERGLVERRQREGATGPKSPWLYRATALGFGLELVDAVPLGSEPPKLVQLRPTGPTGAGQ